MKRKWLFPPLLVLLTVALCALGEENKPARLVVLSYNIHHGEGMDRRIDLPRIAAVIRSVAPDLAAIQEVDRKTQRSGGTDHAETLARLVGMKMVFGRTIDYQGGQYGNMILSRPKIRTSANHPLPFTEGREPRAVLRAEVQWPEGKAAALEPNGVIFYATHLDHTPDSTDRLAAAAVIERLTKADGNRPALLAGDLNSTPGSPTLKVLTKLWAVAETGRPLFTTPVSRPQRQIDFILYRPKSRWRVVEARVLDEAVASDHRPILAVLELLPKK
ncbi:MAG: endonuclease/exonuclease/phosphatase family protein [Candidatus Sumerlaeia bacterium]|nr:endonuclease/exonuclease/phosphatase family protein [Candidatus Sumerlaeia bacterium]